MADASRAGGGVCRSWEGAGAIKETNENSRAWSLQVAPGLLSYISQPASRYEESMGGGAAPELFDTALECMHPEDAPPYFQGRGLAHC
jgi:hypothetical protein